MSTPSISPFQSGLLSERGEFQDGGTSSRNSRLTVVLGFSLLFNAFLWLAPRLAVVTTVSNLTTFEPCNEAPCLYYINHDRLYQKSSTQGFSGAYIFRPLDDAYKFCQNILGNNDTMGWNKCSFDFATIENGGGFELPEDKAGSKVCENWKQFDSLQWSGKNKKEIQERCSSFYMIHHVVNDLVTVKSYWIFIILLCLDAVLRFCHDALLISGYSDLSVVICGMASFICEACSVTASMAWAMTVAETFVSLDDTNQQSLCFYRVPIVSMVLTLGSVFGLAAKFFLRLTIMLEEIYCGAHLYFIDHRVPFRTIVANCKTENNKRGFMHSVADSFVVPAHSAVLVGDRTPDQTDQPGPGCLINYTVMLKERGWDKRGTMSSCCGWMHATVDDTTHEDGRPELSKIMEHFVCLLAIILLLPLVLQLLGPHWKFAVLSLTILFCLWKLTGFSAYDAVRSCTIMCIELIYLVYNWYKHKGHSVGTPFIIVRGVTVLAGSCFLQGFGEVVWARIGWYLVQIAPFQCLGPPPDPTYAYAYCLCVQTPASFAVWSYVAYASEAFLERLRRLDKASQSWNERHRALPLVQTTGTVWSLDSWLHPYCWS